MRSCKIRALDFPKTSIVTVLSFEPVISDYTEMARNANGRTCRNLVTEHLPFGLRCVLDIVFLADTLLRSKPLACELRSCYPCARNA